MNQTCLLQERTPYEIDGVVAAGEQELHVLFFPASVPSSRSRIASAVAMQARPKLVGRLVGLERHGGSHPSGSERIPPLETQMPAFRASFARKPRRPRRICPNRRLPLPQRLGCPPELSGFQKTEHPAQGGRPLRSRPLCLAGSARHAAEGWSVPGNPGWAQPNAFDVRRLAGRNRSEERRGGKECRS